MSKGRLIADLENLQLDYAMKMHRYECINPNAYNLYKKAARQLGYLLNNISIHPELFKSCL